MINRALENFSWDVNKAMDHFDSQSWDLMRLFQGGFYKVAEMVGWSVYKLATQQPFQSPFKKKYLLGLHFLCITTAEKRKDLSAKMTEKYLDRIPIILEAGQGAKITLSDYKFLVPKNATVHSFLFTVKQKVQ